MRPLPIALSVTFVAVLLSGCAGSPASSPADQAGAGAVPGLMDPIPGIALPASPLRSLVPTPQEAPRGMVPLLTSSGPRDLKAVAGFSKDTATASRALAAHGFTGAYVVQYADPADGRVLAVVASRFRDEAGAVADLAADEAAQDGTPVTVAAIGETTQARRGPLPGKAGGELLYLRFRSGKTTWLVAYGARPTADPSIATGLATLLVARASSAG